MDAIVSHALGWWDRLVSSPDPSARNVVILVTSIALYAVFLARRGAIPSPRRTRRPSRCPDSVLRDGGG